jgi:hypothetical protein
MRKKTKTAEPSARDKLSADFTQRLEQKWREHGDTILDAACRESPTKVAELIARLVATTEPTGQGFDNCRNMQDIGARLLLSVGITDPTDDMIAQAVACNDAFIAKLEAIRDRALLAAAIEGEPN